MSGKSAIHGNVVRHNHMGTIAYHKFWIYSFFFHISNFVQEYFWINNHTIANNRHGFAINNSGRDQVELKGIAIYNDGVSGVVAAVKTNDIVRFASKEIGNLSFAFVAPLSANNCRYVRRIGRHRMPRVGLVWWRITSRKYIKIER